MSKRQLLLAMFISANLSTLPVIAEEKPTPPKPTQAVKAEPQEDSGDDIEKADEDDDSDNTDKKEKKEKTFADVVKDLTHIPGYVDFYQDAKTGKTKMVINESLLNQPFLYFATTVNGVTEAGHFEGAYRDEKLLEFRRHYKSLDVYALNNNFTFDENNPLSKAAKANTSEALLVSLPIEFDQEGKLVVPAEGLFLNENIHPVSPMPSRDPKREKDRFQPGKLNPKKTRIAQINNFPANTHVQVSYVFENPRPRNWGTAALADGRFTNITLQHAFIELPDNDFQPRKDDSRIGYFGTYKNDQTDPGTTPYVDYINRWHLVKKDPSAAVSDPVQPIVWWIENTTPEKWRAAIKEGVLAWNAAFEKAGISNALEVRIQPDDADWSADDVRYNVLRWTSSPNPRFGGYGPSLANPLTGEIIAADIMLEFVFMSNRWRYERMFTQGMAHFDQQESPLSQATLSCSKGHSVQQGLMLGQMLQMVEADKDIFDTNESDIFHQAMVHLIMHEVGHTLGLNHNMKASSIRSIDDVHNPDVTQGAISGSVMDYAPINLAPLGKQQGDYYDYRPGPYDYWAIEYGYSQALADPQAEEARLAAILARSTANDLAFGNDADDMRAPGRHIDPHVMTGDMSNDAVTYAEQYIERLHHTASKLPEKLLKAGKSHQDLVVAANIIASSMAKQTEVMSRFIGGVHVNRAVVGQAGYTQPYTPVTAAQQAQAMQALSKYLFAPDAIADLQPLFAYLQPQRRGFAAYGKNEDPKPHGMLLSMQKQVLNHLMHPRVLMRLTDATTYGNEYDVTRMLAELTDAIFAEDISGDVNTYRRNLQIEYLERLIVIAGLERPSKHDKIAQANATYLLKKLSDDIRPNRGDKASRIHRVFLQDRIARALHKSRS